MNGDRVGCESYIIRRVASIEELQETFHVLGAQFTPRIAAEDRVFNDLLDHYLQDRRLMLIAEQDGRMVGGALGFDNTLRVIALKPDARGKGLGRRLIQTYEVAAMRHGIRTISLGAVEHQKGFY